MAIESVVNILGHFKTSYNEKALASQFFVNLLHKCNAAIATINKERFMDELKIVLDESERKIDRYNIEMQTDVYDLRNVLGEINGPTEPSDENGIEYVKILVNNLRKIISVISYT